MSAYKNPAPVPGADAEIKENSIRILKHLITICEDGIRGYQTAADKIDSTRLTGVFREYVQQRQTFTDALTVMLAELGAQHIPDNGDVGGAVHRGWINLRTALASKKSDAVLEESIRGEQVAIDAYREAMKEDITPEVYKTLDQQLQAIEAAQGHLQRLLQTERDA